MSEQGRDGGGGRDQDPSTPDSLQKILEFVQQYRKSAVTCTTLGRYFSEQAGALEALALSVAPETLDAVCRDLESSGLRGQSTGIEDLLDQIPGINTHSVGKG